MLVNASGMWEMAQSELKQKCGIEFQVQVRFCRFYCQTLTSLPLTHRCIRTTAM